METYLLVENVFAGQTPNIQEPFLKILPEFKQIVEIGFHRGGLSLWLHKNKQSDTDLFCYDITFVVKEVNDENINFIKGDCFNEDIKNEIKNIIQREGKTLLLCDGGSKNQEFNLYSQFLKSGDVIMCHDYTDNPNEYLELQRRINWPHPPESNYEEIKSAIEINDLEPFYYEDFKNVLWGSFVKK